MRVRRSGSAKLVWPSPPKVVPMISNRAWLPAMSISRPRPAPSLAVSTPGEATTSPSTDAESGKPPSPWSRQRAADVDDIVSPAGDRRVGPPRPPGRERSSPSPLTGADAVRPSGRARRRSTRHCHRRSRRSPRTRDLLGDRKQGSVRRQPSGGRRCRQTGRAPRHRVWRGWPATPSAAIIQVIARVWSAIMPGWPPTATRVKVGQGEIRQAGAAEDRAEHGVQGLVLATVKSCRHNWGRRRPARYRPVYGP